MHTVQPSLFSRDDTLLGVCEAIGEDFGFNPLWLRVALGFLLLWNPVAVIGGYIAAAVVIACIRFFVPNRVEAPAPQVAEKAAEEDMPEELPLAA